jgi:hypothetical protein
MRIPTFDILGGTTINLTWVNTGSVPTSIRMCLLDKNDALVSSVTPISSGDGHYYAPLMVPTSDAWYVARTIAVLNANTYVHRGLVRTHKLEVS